MVSPDGPPVCNPITGTWRNSFADKGQKGRDLEKFDRMEELIGNQHNTKIRVFVGKETLHNLLVRQFGESS
jgi:hypothetical protein